MTEEAPGTPAPRPDPGSAVTPPVIPAPSKRKRRRWRRRLLWLGLGAISLLVLVRVTLPFTLPYVLKKVAAKYKLSVTYERMDRSFLGGYAEIWHLIIAPEEGGEPFVHFEYTEADLVVSSLLFGRIEFRRLEVDGADLFTDRDEDGKLRLFKRMGIGEGKAAEPRPAAKPAADDGEPAEVDLRPPIAIDALRFQHAHWRIRDRSVSPPLDVRLIVNLRLSDLGSEVRPARFEVDVASPEILDSFHAEGLASTTKDALTLAFEATLRGLHPAPLAGYLEPLGLRPAADDISFRAHGTAAARAAAAPGTIEASLRIEDVAVEADGETALAMAEMAVDAPSIGRDAAHVKEVRIAGARVAARVTGAGLPRAAGIEVAGRGRPSMPQAPPAAAPAPPPAAPPATGAADPAAPAPAPYRLRIDRVALVEAAAMLRDDSFFPAAFLMVHAAEAAVTDIVKDPDLPGAAAAITARLDAPGIFDDLRIDGRAVPFARRKTVELGLVAAGIRLDALAPYLARLGAQPALAGGRFEGTLDAVFEAREDGTIAADLRIGPAAFTDAETLLDFGGLDVCGVEVDPASNAVSITDITGSGPRIAARRDAGGNVEVLGIRLEPGRPAVASAPPAAPVDPPVEVEAGEEPIARASPAAFREDVPPEAAAPATPPLRLRIGRLRWSGAGASFADDAVVPSALITIEDAGIQLEDLSIDLDPEAPGAPTRFDASLAVRGIAERISIVGALDPRPSSAWLGADVSATGISFSAAAPYLAAAGVEPAVKEGSATCSVAVDLSSLAGLVDAGLAIRDARFGEGAVEFAGVEGLRVKDIQAGGDGGLRIASVEVDRPRASALRDEAGAVHFGGLRLAPRVAGEGPPGGTPASSAPAPVEAPAGAAPAPAGPSFRLDLLRVRDARLAWTDRALAEPLSMALSAAADVDDFAIGSKEPARFRARAVADGALDEGLAEGTLAIEPGAVAAAIDVRARGIRAGPLAAYLPPGIQVGLRDGRFAARVEAASAAVPEGGRSARLVVSGVDYRDGEGSPPLLKLGAFKVIAPRIDPAGGRIELDEISAAGFEMGAALPAPGAVETLGVVIGPRPVPDTPAPAASPEPDSAPAAALPATRRLRALREKPPRLTIRKLDLGLDRLSVRHGAAGEATPLVLERVRLANDAEIDLLGDHPEENPPVVLSLTGKVAPIVESFGAGFRILPFAGQPRLEIDVEAEGVNGKDLSAVLPLLAGKVDGTGLTDGRLSARFETTLRPDRRSALDPGIGRAFGIETILKEVSFRNGAEGPVLLGLDELRVDVTRIDPSTGAVHVKDIEVQKPVAAVRRVAEGVEVAGLVVKLPGAPPADAPAGDQAEKPAPARAPAPAAAPGPAAERPEMRVDKLLVNGVDFRADDVTCEPPFHFWLDDVEVEVRNISNRLFSDPKPIRFHVAVRSGKVPIPIPLEASAITGVIADASAMLSGREVDTAAKVAERPVFEDYVLGGKVSLHPAPGGWVETRLSGLDLAAFRGLASQFGVTLQGGIVDSRTIVRLPGDGSLTTETRLKLSDLDVSEASDGPIFRYLKLPAPLGTVIFAIRDEDGVISVPLDVTMAREGITAGAIVSALLGTMGQVIGQAFLNTPFRMASTLTSLVPGEEAPLEPEEPLELEFPGGGPELAGAEAAKLAPLIERIADGEPVQVALRHEFGGEDLARANERANPPLADCLEIAARLRREKARLLLRREEAAARARNAVLSGLWRESAAATAALRDLDRDIHTTDQGLQDLHERLRPGAERQEPRRARGVAIAIARARLAAVEAALAAAAGDRTGQVIRSMRPVVPEKAPGEGKVVVTITRAK